MKLLSGGFEIYFSASGAARLVRLARIELAASCSAGKRSIR